MTRIQPTLSLCLVWLGLIAASQSAWAARMALPVEIETDARFPRIPVELNIDFSAFIEAPQVLNPNTIIASADMVAADAYTVAQFEWYGKKYKPSQVRYIREAHKRKLGRMDIENLVVKAVTI